MIFKPHLCKKDDENDKNFHLKQKKILYHKIFLIEFSTLKLNPFWDNYLHAKKLFNQSIYHFFFSFSNIKINSLYFLKSITLGQEQEHCQEAHSTFAHPVLLD